MSSSAFFDKVVGMSEDHIQTVRRLLRSKEKFRKSRILFLGEGVHYLTFTLDDKFVLRLSKSVADQKLLKREASLLEVLQKNLNIPVPDYRVSDSKGRYVIYPKLLGDPLKNRRELNALSKISRLKIAKQLGEFLKILHSTDLKGLRRTTVRQTWYESPGYINYLRTAIPAKLGNSAPANLKRKIDLYLSEWDKKIAECRGANQVLLHQDLGSSNILILKRKSIGGIIDFGNAAIGNAVHDFVSLEKFGKSFLETVIEHYDMRDALKSEITFFSKRTILLDALHNAEGSIALETIKKIRTVFE